MDFLSRLSTSLILTLRQTLLNSSEPVWLVPDYFGLFTFVEVT